MSRRLVLGAQSDGSMALRVSAPSYDALTATDDGHAINFDSRWTDIAKIWSVAYANATLFSSSPTEYSCQFIWTSLGYIPFVEVRRVTGGNVVNDDFYSSGFPYGYESQILINGLNYGLETSPTGLAALCVVYAIPVPG